VKNSISHDLSDQERVLEPLAHALAAGFTEAGRSTLSSTATTTCVKSEPASLRGLLKSTGLTGADIRFDAGISGSALLVLANPDLALIGGLISGLEFAAEETIGAEVMEACLQFFAKAMEACGKSLAHSHGLAIHSLAPELLNPDGKSDSLRALADSYADTVCLTFQITMEGHPAPQFMFLVDRDLLASLNAQLPNYAVAASGGSARSRSENAASKGTGVQGETQPPKWNMDLILDVELEVAVSFGETEMPLRDILKLGVGSVIELEKAVNDPVAILVNNKPIARGEVVVVDGNYGVRVLEVESTADRIRSLG
jgi:flagellar motor switch protein FliN